MCIRDSFNIVALLAVAWAAAILGDQCNFMIGHFFGTKIIASGKVKAMTPERIKKSEDFLDKWEMCIRDRLGCARLNARITRRPE